MVEIIRDLNEIYSRNKVFFEREKTERPLLGMFYIGKNYMRTFKNTYNSIPKKRELLPDDINTKDLISDFEDLISITDKIGLDMLFPVSPFQYVTWMEAIVGCPVVAGKESFFSKPFFSDWASFDKKVNTDTSNKWIAKILEDYKVLVEYFGETYPISCSTHMRGPADMISAVMGPSRFCLELYDNPADMKRLIRSYTDTFIKVAKIQHEMVKKLKLKKGFTVSGFGLLTPIICQHVQDDAIALLSPELYREFFLESHQEIIRSFDSVFYHVHPVSLFVVDEIVKMEKVEVIEINREPVAIGPDMLSMIPALKKIQKHDKSVYMQFTDINFGADLIENEIDILLRNLSNEGLCINVCVADENDSKARIKIYKKFFRL